MKLNTLAIALAVAGLSLPATQVSADIGPDPTGPFPNLTKAEKGAFAMLESLFSGAAAAIEANTGGCGAMQGFYGVNTTAFSDGSGNARVDHFFVVTFAPADNVRGHIFNVVQVPAVPPVVGADGDINGVLIDDYNGTYGYDRTGGIMWGAADLLMEGDPYDEHIIKDFWTRETDVKNEKVIADEGLEVITKLDFPRTKWFQSSDYTREDGVEGAIAWTKTQIAPFGSDLCQMAFTGQVDLQGHGFQLIGGLLQIQFAPAAP